MFAQLQRRLRIPLAPGTDVARLLAAAPPTTSAADLEGILVRASRRMATLGAKALDAALLGQLIADFEPPSYPLEIEYQRLIAAFECTSRALLPADLAAMPAAEIAARLNELRAAVAR